MTTKRNAQRWFLAMVMLLLIGLVVGCGQGEGNKASPPETQSGTDAGGEELHTDPSDATGDVANSDNGADEETSGDDAQSSDDKMADEPVPADVPIDKTYHMNKSYFIKPNNEEDNKKVVLLTFDDGPKELDMLTSILDTLDKHNAKAIFFVNGYRVKANPDLLKLIDERGQIVGNHSYDHIDLKKESHDKVDQQVEGVQNIVQETIGKTPQFFRPPFGSGNDYLKDKVKQLGMLYMTWSNGSLDWADNQRKPDGVIKSVMKQLAPGSNILMHELPWTAEALDELLDNIEEAGYSFVDPRAIELEARS